MKLHNLCHNSTFYSIPFQRRRVEFFARCRAESGLFIFMQYRAVTSICNLQDDHVLYELHRPVLFCTDWRGLLFSAEASCRDGKFTLGLKVNSNDCCWWTKMGSLDAFLCQSLPPSLSGSFSPSHVVTVFGIDCLLPCKLCILQLGSEGAPRWVCQREKTHVLGQCGSERQKSIQVTIMSPHQF